MATECRDEKGLSSVSWPHVFIAVQIFFVYIDLIADILAINTLYNEGREILMSLNIAFFLLNVVLNFFLVGTLYEKFLVVCQLHTLVEGVHIWKDPRASKTAVFQRARKLDIICRSIPGMVFQFASLFAALGRVTSTPESDDFQGNTSQSGGLTSITLGGAVIVAVSIFTALLSTSFTLAVLACDQRVINDALHQSSAEVHELDDEIERERSSRHTELVPQNSSNNSTAQTVVQKSSPPSSLYSTLVCTCLLRKFHPLLWRFCLYYASELIVRTLSVALLFVLVPVFWLVFFFVLMEIILRGVAIAILVRINGAVTASNEDRFGIASESPLHMQSAMAPSATFGEIDETNHSSLKDYCGRDHVIGMATLAMRWIGASFMYFSSDTLPVHDILWSQLDSHANVRSSGGQPFTSQKQVQSSAFMAKQTSHTLRTSLISQPTLFSGSNHLFICDEPRRYLLGSAVTSCYLVVLLLLYHLLPNALVSETLQTLRHESGALWLLSILTIVGGCSIVVKGFLLRVLFLCGHS